MVTTVDTLVVGGGQSGLAAAQQVQAHGGDVLVLDASPEIGATWRSRWDSLVLFTPSERDGLPGMPFPAARGTFPAKDAIADYLIAYARRFSLPVHSGVRVDSVAREGDRYAVGTARGDSYVARSVIVAGGAHARPSLPALAASVPASLPQLHSLDYRRPDPFAGQDVLVVGAAASGVQIAIELAGGARVHLAGRPTPHVPDAVLRGAPRLYWGLLHRVLTVRTPVGRRAAVAYHRRGGPLIRVSVKDVRRAGVTLHPRVAAVDGDRILFADGSGMVPDAIVWATGSTPDLDWIPMIPTGPGAAPVTVRGVVAESPGLYTVGMPFQYGLTSTLIGGVGRDAAYVARAIMSAARRPRRTGTSEGEGPQAPARRRGASIA